MFKYSAALFVVVFFLVAEVPSSVLADDGVDLGLLYSCAHEVKGQVFVKNKLQITIKGFNYDGTGPAAWFHGQLPAAEGISTSDEAQFVPLPYPTATCGNKLGPFQDKNVELTLPRPITDFKSIGVFCYEKCHNFGHVIIPEGKTFAEAPASVMKTNPCPKPSEVVCAYNATMDHNQFMPTTCTPQKPTIVEEGGKMMNATAGPSSQQVSGLTTFFAGGAIALYHFALKK